MTPQKLGDNAIRLRFEFECVCLNCRDCKTKVNGFFKGDGLDLLV